jgi:hypothetical protein
MNYEAIPNHHFKIILLWTNLFNIVCFCFNLQDISISWVISIPQIR